MHYPCPVVYQEEKIDTAEPPEDTPLLKKWLLTKFKSSNKNPAWYELHQLYASISFPVASESEYYKPGILEDGCR
jgi:hypothetical protein